MLDQEIQIKTAVIFWNIIETLLNTEFNDAWIQYSHFLTSHLINLNWKNKPLYNKH